MNLEELEGLKNKLMNQNDEKSLYCLSLIYRYKNNYAQELEIVNQALSLYSENGYFLERKHWHNLSLSEKKVSRQQLLITEREEWREAVIPKTTFVTGTDANPKYFEFLCEMLLSLKLLNAYSKVDINIIDCGMTDEQKHYLVQHFNVKNIFKSNINLEIKSGSMHTCQITRPFIAQYFPGYQYYFHMDGDIWIQDEYALDRMLLLAMEQGFSGACHTSFFMNESGKHFIDSNIIMWEKRFKQFLLRNDKGVIASKPYQSDQDLYIIHPGILCIDREAAFFGGWQSKIINILRDRGAFHNAEEVAFNNTFMDKLSSFKMVSARDNFLMCVGQHYLSLLSKENTLLFMNNTILGVIHMDCGKEVYDNDFNIHDRLSGNKEKINFHFKVWPWKDKEDIKQKILKFL